MRRTVFLMAASLLLGCDLSAGGSACEEARSLTKNLIDDACQSKEYEGTPFCTCCVKLGYYSVADDCMCRDLVYDAKSCLYANGDQARPSVRAAIEYANTTCSSEKFGVAPWDEVPDAARGVCEPRAPQSGSAGEGGAAGSGEGAGSGAMSGGAGSGGAAGGGT